MSRPRILDLFCGAGGAAIIHRIIMGHTDTIATFAALWPWLSEPKREQFIRASEEIHGATKTA